MTRRRTKEIRSSYEVHRPTNMPFWNEIVCGDSNVLLKLVPSNSVNLVITSPPYFNQRNYGSGIGNEKFATQYIDSLMTIFSECVRILKPSGSIVLNLGDKYEDSSLLLMPYRFAIAALEQLQIRLVNNVTWVKTNPTPRQFKRRLVSSTEPFFHFVKTDEYQYFIDEFLKADAGPEKPTNGNGAGANVGKKYFSLIDQSQLTDKQKSMARDALAQVIEETQRGDIDSFRMKIRGIHSEPFGGQDGGRKIQLTKNGFTIIRIYGNPLKKDVISTPVESLKNCPHPAIYPVRIVEEFLRLLTKPGDIVLDPFVGSGSTAVASLKQQRVFIGFDINPEYCEYAQARLVALAYQPSLV